MPNKKTNWLLQKGTIISTAILYTLIFSGCYINNPENNINPFAVALLAIICVSTGLGAIQFLVGIANFVKNPSIPSIRGGWEASGLGTFGCEWSDSGGHISTYFGGGCDSGGDIGGGCDGG